MPFLFTISISSPRAKLYVSLNRLHATSPQGTMGLPSAVASGLQVCVSLTFLGFLSCASLQLFTYLLWFW
uniref:Uncharacterized protein n=1 Tax=Arundo donax TaxID=35708 RepID=A0A0A9DFH8_ARUDO